MRTLALDTATEACSVALFDDQKLVANQHEVLGRGHAEQLIPMIAALPDNGRADRIVVSLGPGSFTGVRIGIAAARALAIAWQATVLGFPTLALVAAQARANGQAEVTVCMNAGHGEWFVQNFDRDGGHDTVRSLAPTAAMQQTNHDLIAGNRARELAEALGDQRRVLELLPDASKTPLLEPSELTERLAPIYGRAPDAVPQPPRRAPKTARA